MTIPSDQRKQYILAGATLIGMKHVLEDSCSQDALLFREYPFGAVLAVADGVGSECYSQYGSESAVRAVHSAFIALANGCIEPGHIADSIFYEYKNGIADELKEHAATTCVYAAYIVGHGLYLGQAGDGLCCGSINGNNFILQHKYDDFTNIVIPLSAVHNSSEWVEGYFPDADIKTVSLMLATDGVSEDILPGKECAFADFIISHLSDLSVGARENYLRQLLRDWVTPKSNDDKSFCFFSFQKAEV